MNLVKFGTDMGAPVTTSIDDVDLQVAVLETNLDGLDRAIVDWYRTVAKTTAIDQFVAGWDGERKAVRAFIHQWRTRGFAWIRDNIIPGRPYPGPILKGAWNYYDQARTHQENVRKWRLGWQKVSGQTLTTPEGTSEPPPEAGSGANVLVYGLLAVAGVYGASRLIEAVKK
jgi:hypothetical protein